MRRVNVPLVLFLAGLASSARANDFMFSAAAAPVVFPLMLLWAVAGVVGAIVLRPEGVRLDHVGLGAVASVGVAMSLLGGHVEVIGMIWMVYLALATVYYAVPRQGVPSADRQANLALHGTFLGLVIAGGIVAKVVFWSNMGGYARWAETMVAFYPSWLVLSGFLMAVGLLWFGVTTARRSRRAATTRVPGPRAERRGKR